MNKKEDGGQRLKQMQAIKREIYQGADITASDYHNGWLVGSQRTQKKSLVLCCCLRGVAACMAGVESDDEQQQAAIKDRTLPPPGRRRNSFGCSLS